MYLGIPASSLTTKYFAAVEFGHTTEHIVHFVSSCQYVDLNLWRADHLLKIIIILSVDLIAVVPHSCEMYL